MAGKRLSISAFALGALLGLPVTAARADEPVTVEQAQAAAQSARDRAEHYRSLGGVGYKTGLVQSAELDAAKYDAMAQSLAEVPVQAAPAQTPNPSCLPTKPPTDALCNPVSPGSP
jgi:hypothetical protein